MQAKPLPKAGGRRPVPYCIGLLFLLGSFLVNPGAAGAQTIYDTRISLNAQNEPIRDILSEIEQKTPFTVAYNARLLNTDRRISVSFQNETVDKILQKLFEGTAGKVSQLDRKHVIIHSNRTSPETSSKKSRQWVADTAFAITGLVTDEKGTPLSGVNIQVKGSGSGTITSKDGRFSLTLEKGAVLVISSVGYQNQELTIREEGHLVVVLQQQVTTMNEVVVVGYGTKRRNEVVGAIATVPVTDIKSRNYNNTAEVLQGVVPGLTVISNGGSPTANPSFKIRGLGSINEESPLLVVDKVIYNGSLNSINPKDIESISVLKDASASIYGARASGGVILITTKKGSRGEPKLSLNYQQGYQQTGKRLQALNAAEFADVVNKVRAEGGLLPDPAFDPSVFPDARVTKTNWMDEIFQTGKIHDITGSISGGSDKSDFFISGGYRRNEGVLLNTYSSRFSARINSSYKLSDKIRIGENIAYSLSNGQSGNTTSAQEGTILTAIFYPPNATVYREDGSGRFGGVPEKYSGSYGDVINPVAYLKRLDVNNPVNEVLLNGYLEWDILKGLSFRSNWSYTRIKNDYKEFKGKITEPGKIFNFNELVQNSSTFASFLNEQTLHYNRSFAGDHRLNLMAGHTFEQWKNESFGVTATGFDNEMAALRYLDNSTQAISLGKFSGTGSEVGLESYLGRVGYTFRDKYIFDATIRRDGTSKLTSANRWEWYPSVAAGWVLTKERFLQPGTVLSYLKLRASWGQIGNLGVLGNYAFSIPLTKTQALIGATTTIVPGYAETRLSNPDLKWEISEQKNLGVDFSLLKNRLSGSVDFFVKDNRQMQFNQILPGVAGAPGGQTINAGRMQNRGIETSLSYKNQVGDLQYTLTGNLAVIKNELKELYDGNTSYMTGTRVRSLPLPNIVQVGEALNAYYGYKTAGLFRSDAEAAAYTNKNGVRYQPNARGGDIRFVDINSDGVLDSRDQQILGNPFPSLTYSFNAGLSYKAFDLNLFFQGVSGNEIFNAVKHTGLNAAFPGYNLLSNVKDAWSPENPDGSIPRLSIKDANNNFSRMSDFYIEDGSYVRLKNLTVGYTLPKQFMNRVGARFYLTGHNLFTITNYSGMDPEVGLTNLGLDLGMYPVAKSFLLGIDLTF